MIATEEYLTVQQVADKLDMHVQTIRTYIHRGDINARKIGRKYIITQEELDDFIKGGHNSEYTG
ncbi:helix-turn-helix domain-containing protein [Staphylococcus capitis]|uniref:helix-turn-helix domain-containing protein n=1 Tax=Staphylococcus capitis TaxID=29388 RepID=UPI001E5D8014|nr:helix-turn-helix domain-containing protein [Staphylococcus capitis]MCC9117511.1 helix-turn-helix domain-containing protein [Staphylococcus capitis]MCC9143963.1 helix-turn-helix domain-containing protein [Staphylococcus capitis]